MLTLTRRSASSVPAILAAAADSVARRTADSGPEPPAAAWRGQALSQTDRLALAALRDRYPEVDLAELSQLAPRAVTVMTEHAGHGCQVAAVAALLGRSGLGTGSPADRRQAAVAVVDAVTSSRGLPARRWGR